MSFLKQQAQCGTAAGPAHSRPIVFWQASSPSGVEVGHPHSRYLDISADLMEISEVANEVNDRMRGARDYNWTPEDENLWVRENAPHIAKEMGYKISRVVR